MKERIGRAFLKISEKILGYPPCKIPRRKGKKHMRKGIKESPFIKRKAIKTYTYHKIIPNKYPYTGMSEHYLLVPLDSNIGSFLHYDNIEAKAEIIDILGEWENKGYYCFTQQYKKSETSSVYHKHIHITKDYSQIQYEQKN